MRITQPLLLLLAVNLTYATFASEPTLAHHRKEIAKNALQKLADKEAARCNAGCQVSCKCSRPGIQMAMVRDKAKTHAVAVQVNPKDRMVHHFSQREASAERAHGRATVGSSVVVLRNRSEIGGARSTGPARGPQPGRSKL